MKAMVGVVAIACAVGCNVDSLETSETHQALTDCTDPSQPCRLRNGVGVYTEEDGNAHVGADDFMIMRFINQSGSVAILGRGQLSSGDYGMSMGTVDGAVYNGTPYHLDSVDETLTEPVFNLIDANGALMPKSPLDITLRVTVEGKRYAIRWFDDTAETVRGPSGQMMHSFGMRWSIGDTYSATNSYAYCHTASGAAEKAVFQRGIGVQPLTAVMVRNGNFVTLSCRSGAIAMARWWGYIYRGTEAQADMYEAAMHMKRASYCGDITDYTKSGTAIQIEDNVGIENAQLSTGVMEASWGRDPSGIGPVHALCLTTNSANLRHPELLPVDLSQFDRTCNNTLPTPMQDCATYGLGSLADAK